MERVHLRKMPCKIREGGVWVVSSSWGGEYRRRQGGKADIARKTKSENPGGIEVGWRG